MKIAVFHNTFGEGGARRVLYHFVRGLQDRGHHIDLYTFSSVREETLPISDHVANRITVDLEDFAASTSQQRCVECVSNSLRRAIYLRRLNSAYRLIASEIDRKDYDVVYADICKYTMAPYLLRHLKTPVAFFCHNPVRRLREPEYLFHSTESAASQGVKETLCHLVCKVVNGIYAAWARREERVNASHADLVVTNSIHTQKFIREAYGRKAAVNYLGVDVHLFRPLGGKKKGYVLSVGGMQRHKRFNEIIEALGRIAAEKRPPLMLVGNRSDPQVKAELVQLAERRGVELTIRESIPQEDLVVAYNEAMMVVFVPFMEPFGLIPLEAMACGTPVIGVAEGGVKESIRDEETGMLVERGAEDLASAIELLMERDEVREIYAAKGLKEVREHWAWEHAIEQFEHTLQEVAGQQATP